MSKSTLGNTIRDIAIEAEGLEYNERFSLQKIAKEVDKLVEENKILTQGGKRLCS